MKLFTQRWLFFLMAFLLAKASDAQKKQYLSLSDAVTATTEKNTAIQVAKADEQTAKARYKQTDAVFLPQASFSYTASTTNNPLNAFGMKLQQGIITMNDFDPATLNNPSATGDFTTRLQVQQPIINLDMWHQRKAAAEQLHVYRLTSQRTREYLALQTQTWYLLLQLLYEEQKVLQSALTTASAFEKLMLNYYNEGLIQKSDLLNAQLHILGIETRQSENNNNIRNVSDVLSQLMGQQPGIVYGVDTLQLVALNNDSVTISTQRADLMAMSKSIDAYSHLITATRKSFMPRLNAFASYQFNNNTLLQYNASAYMAGIQLSWDIFKGNSTRYKIAEQQSEQQKIQLQLQQQTEQSSLLLEKARRDAANAVQHMHQYQEGMAQAAEALRIVQNRFQQGLVKSADVLAAQTQLTEQQMQYKKAIYDYNFAGYQIQFLTATSH